MDTWDSGRVRRNSRRSSTCFSQSPSLPQQVRQTHKSFSSCDTSSFGDQTTSTCEKTGKREEDARRPQKKICYHRGKKGQRLYGFALVSHVERRAPVKRYCYSERDYAFGQAMLTLRTSIGLTQAGLADLLRVSRRAVAEWEGGSNYPKEQHLQHFIAVCVQQHVFASGREEEEIRALWKMAHQRVLLDEAWLAAVLTQPSAPPAPVEEAGGAAAVRQASPAPVQLSPPAEMPVAHAGEEPASSPRVDWVGALDVSH